MRSDTSQGVGKKTIALPDPDLHIKSGKGKSLEIPEAGYILDLAIFYDYSMVAKFGDDVITRYVH